jgi:hypothetical protein
VTQTCAASPCVSCPYRRDVPSGIWDASEYERLPKFDGTLAEQALAGALHLFGCHQDDGRLCAGWIAAHGAENLLAVLVRGALRIDPAVFDFESPVPVFGSGREARAHGLRDIDHPGQEARRMMARIERKQGRR